MNNGPIMSEALENNISFAIEHIDKKDFESANIISVTLLNQLHMIGDGVDNERLLEKIIELLNKYRDYLNKGKISKEKAEVIETIFNSLNYLSMNIFREKKTIPLKGNQEIYRFYIVVVKERWKEILEYKLWEIIIQTMMSRGGNDPKKAFYFTEETVGVPKKLLKEYVKQSQVGLLAYGTVMGNYHIREIANHFEEALKAEHEITTIE
ncbi:MAG: hypothetical protein H7647_03335 [Candidatus Heimdallarchaeota archaeon]|nr:hypothetical protein [Candidatus Heimdallarchaeota archaeon]MCK4253461.1 hypothetical protein [Candidatus Heimdallarchaeota archaeon]